MKRRNLFLSLLLAGACAIVGVGYATITRELNQSLLWVNSGMLIE